MSPTEPPPRIHDHGLIGDCRGAALVARDGTIDWLCWPRFDSPAVFAALLDGGALERGGGFTVAPDRDALRSAGLPAPTVQRRYVPDTNVLETRFELADGAVLVVTDFMPVSSEDERRAELAPEHELVRLVACARGEVPVEVRFAPRPGFARERVRVSDRGVAHRGLRVESRTGLHVLRAGPAALAAALRFERVDGGAGASPGTLRARCVLRAGQALALSLTLSREGPAVLAPLEAGAPAARLARTVAYWTRFAARARYRGPLRDAVVRSALALKLTCFSPSGALIAAPTTSLPERPGAGLNWDYRFCWLRDAALVARALLGLGYDDEARAYTGWLLHATRLTLPALRVLYDVYGRSPGPERELGHLAGYRASRPVRTGNAARDQLQLDVYGEVVDAVAQAARGSDCAARRPQALDREASAMLASLGEQVCASWRAPDEGIWEPRETRREHTVSRALCWVALDRLLELDRRGLLDRGRGLPRASAARFAAARDAIRRDIETRAFDPARGSYVAVAGAHHGAASEVDAALLLLSWYGYAPADAPRMRGTYARIARELGVAPPAHAVQAARAAGLASGVGAVAPLLYRNAADRARGEGAFGVACFWAVDHLARGGGTLAEARAALAALAALGNDVGLYGEEIDPGTGEALGNFPQAFTHVGLINAALSLATREARARAEGDAAARTPTAWLEGVWAR